jgi:hypothetical protein
MKLSYVSKLRFPRLASFGRNSQFVNSFGGLCRPIEARRTLIVAPEVLFGVLGNIFPQLARRRPIDPDPPPMVTHRFDREYYKPLFELSKEIVRNRLVALESAPHFSSKELSAALSVPLPALRSEDTLVVKGFYDSAEQLLEWVDIPFTPIRLSDLKLRSLPRHSTVILNSGDEPFDTAHIDKVLSISRS